MQKIGVLIHWVIIMTSSIIITDLLTVIVDTSEGCSVVEPANVAALL